MTAYSGSLKISVRMMINLWSALNIFLPGSSTFSLFCMRVTEAILFHMKYRCGVDMSLGSASVLNSEAGIQVLSVLDPHLVAKLFIEQRHI